MWPPHGEVRVRDQRSRELITRSLLFHPWRVAIFDQPNRRCDEGGLPSFDGSGGISLSSDWSRTFPIFIFLRLLPSSIPGVGALAGATDKASWRGRASSSGSPSTKGRKHGETSRPALP